MLFFLDPLLRGWMSVAASPRITPMTQAPPFTATATPGVALPVRAVPLARWRKGFLLKEQPQEVLVAQLLRMTQGEPPLSPPIARRGLVRP